MSNAPIVNNAKKALKEMKLEISQELGINTEHIDMANETSYECGNIGGNLGGLMSKKLVEIGEKVLLEQYKSKYKN